MMKYIWILIFLLTISSAWAQSSFNLNDGQVTDVSWSGNDVTLQVTRPDGKVVSFTFETRTIPKGTIQYHWTTEDHTKRWNQQGYIDHGEVDFLRTPSGNKQVYGAGVYTSESALNSKDFGESLAAFEMPEDTKMITSVKGGSYNMSINSFNKAEMDILKKYGIHGHFATSNTDGNWWVFTDEVPLRKVRKATAADFVKSADVKKLSEANFLKDLKLQRQFPYGSHPDLPGGDILKILQEPKLRTVLTKDQKRRLITMIEKAGPSAESAKRYRPLLTDNVVFGEFGFGDKLNLFKRYYTITGRELDPTGAIFTKNAPEYKELLLQGKLTPSSRSALLKQISTNQFSLEELPPKLRQALAKEFRTEALEFYRTKKIAAAPQWHISPAELSAEEDLFSGTIKTSTALTLPTSNRPLTPYAENLLDAREFIDAQDLRLAMAKGVPEPWRLYDEPNGKPLIERWKAASTNSNQTLIQRHAILFEVPAEYRKNRVIAGGEIDPGNGKKYYRVDGVHKKVLETNPYLTLEVVDDPYQAAFGEKTYLVRHEYPSFATYEKFKGELSATLVADLDKLKAAEGLGSNSAEAGELTKKIIGQLVNKLEQANLTDLKRYQLQMSVHPFADYNGRTLRAAYKANNSGNPLLLKSFDDDLFLTSTELSHRANLGLIEQKNIKSAMELELSRNPTFPKLYDLPELWEEIPGMAQNPIGIKYKRSETIKKFYSTPQVQSMVKDKDFVKLQSLVHDNFFVFVGGLPDNERRTFLLKDIIKTNSPILTTNDAVLSKLYKDLSILSKTPNNNDAIAQWLAVQKLQNSSPANHKKIEEFMQTMSKESRDLYYSKYFVSDMNADMSKVLSAEENLAFMKKELSEHFNPGTINKIVAQYEKTKNPKILDILFSKDLSPGSYMFLTKNINISSMGMDDSKKAMVFLRALGEDTATLSDLTKLTKDLGNLTFDPANPEIMEAIKNLNATIQNAPAKQHYLSVLSGVYNKTKNPYILTTFMDYHLDSPAFIFEKLELLMKMDVPDVVKAKYALEVLYTKDLGYSRFQDTLGFFKKVAPTDPAFLSEFKKYQSMVENPMKEWPSQFRMALEFFEEKIPEQDRLTTVMKSAEAQKEALRLKKFEEEIQAGLKSINGKNPDEIIELLSKLDEKKMASPYIQKVVIHQLMSDDPKVFSKALNLLEKSNIDNPQVKRSLKRRLQALTYTGFPDGPKVEEWKLSSLYRKTISESWMPKFMPEIFHDLSEDLSSNTWKSRSEMKKFKNKCANVWERLMNHPVKVIVGGTVGIAAAGLYAFDPQAAKDMGKFIVRPIYDFDKQKKDLDAIGTPDEDKELRKVAK